MISNVMKTMKLIQLNAVPSTLTFWRSKQDYVGCFDGELLPVDRVLDAERRDERQIVRCQSTSAPLTCDI